MEQDIINNYNSRVSNAGVQADKYQKLANTYSLLRLSVFGLLILSVYFAIVFNNTVILLLAFIVLALGFAWLVSRQSRFDSLKKYFQDLKKVNENELESIRSRSNIYDNGSGFIDEKHFYTADLDIFGNASLFQLLNRAATTPGIIRIAEWLQGPSKKEVILSRQQAVQELAEKNDWKLDMQARLLFSIKQTSDQFRQLFAYLRTPLNLSGETWLNKYVKVAPYLLLAAIVLTYFYPLARPVAVLIGLINIGIVFSKAMYIKKADLIAGKIGDILGRYASVFEKIENESWRSGYANALALSIKNGHTSARIKELSELINKLNYHLNMLVGFFLNLFLLWDIRQIIAIENWKRANQESLEAAFDVIAEYEALISLASLRINYPGWCLPVIADGTGYTVTAARLAHPLINEDNRVDNDYELDDAYRIDIITGSNMAGKSTFLRTIGINTVLALCGAPVCAGSMQVSVVTILSYMRIKDSLNESTSTFKAELDRLQMLLTAVESDTKVFFLIDEMLRGTNSVDKYLGSKAVIKQLIRKKGVGLVATHDLQIAELEKEYPDYIRNFYFDIQVKEGEMLFDYKIKHGECKTFNASLLLKQIGIDVNAE
ncbi:MAG: mutS 5 [Mucilaginibacter sp.]|nr:mutS 5 [Mucilaginibacter sp.]